MAASAAPPQQHRAQLVVPAAATSPAAGPAENAEQSLIQQQSSALLEGMSQQEREEAYEELTQRLKPSTLDFLRKRASQRSQAAGPGAAAAAAAAGVSSARAGRAVRFSLDGEEAGCGTAAAAATASSAPAAQAGQPPGARRGQRAGDAQPPPQPPPPPAAAVSLLERLALGLDGEVVGVRPAGAPPSPAEHVLMRDSLRRAAGAAPEGYTLAELPLLLRSSHAPQRALGLRMLAAVARRARPDVCCVGASLREEPRAVMLPGGAAEGGGRCVRLRGVTWAANRGQRAASPLQHAPLCVHAHSWPPSTHPPLPQ